MIEPGPRNTCVSFCFLTVLALSGGCASRPGLVNPGTALEISSADPGTLFDVHVQLFDYAVPEAAGEKGSANEAMPAAVQTAERHFVSFHLKNTLQQSGQWGAVRVVPAPTFSSPFIASGRILESHGKRLSLEVRASDATGRSCFLRTYTMEAEAETYEETFKLGSSDVFQPVYNAIANDLLSCRNSLDQQEASSLPHVAAMRYAAELVPETFSAYLETDAGGQVSLTRMPAESDPMIARVRLVQERERDLLDTINLHYAGFYGNLWDPYLAWRRLTREQVEELERLHGRQWWAPFGGLVGGLIAGGGVFIATAGDLDTSTNEGPADRAARRAYEIGDKLPFDYERDIKFLSSELANAGTALAADMAPFQVHLESSTRKLTGSASEQFAQWRELLKQIHLVEQGAVVDPGADDG